MKKKNRFEYRKKKLTWTKTNKHPEREYPQTKNNLSIIQINMLHVNMICTIQEISQSAIKLVIFL